MLTRSAAAMLMLVFTLPMAARADAVADFYRDRTVMVVGYGPGGGYDFCARLIARHIGLFQAVPRNKSDTPTHDDDDPSQLDLFGKHSPF